jgi:hypothetical protein
MYSSCSGVLGLNQNCSSIWLYQLQIAPSSSPVRVQLAMTSSSELVVFTLYSDSVVQNSVNSFQLLAQKPALRLQSAWPCVSCRGHAAAVPISMPTTAANSSCSSPLQHPVRSIYRSQASPSVRSHAIFLAVRPSELFLNVCVHSYV